MESKRQHKRTSQSFSNTNHIRQQISEKTQFSNEINQLARLIKDCQIAKLRAIQAYKEQAEQAEQKVQQLKEQFGKQKFKNQSLYRENQQLIHRVTELKRGLQSTQKPRQELPEPQMEQLKFKILRKLNQDSSHALNQLAEAAMEAEDIYD